MKFPGFLAGTYYNRVPNSASSRTINMYPEIVESGTGKDDENSILLSVPGQKLELTMPQGPVRGLYRTAKDNIICVAGSTVYYISYSGSWTITPIIDLTTSTGEVSIQDGIPNLLGGAPNNGLVNCIIIVDGSDRGVLIEDGTSTAVQLNTGNAFAGASFVTFQDGFFIFSPRVSQKTQKVAFAADPYNIDALDYVVVNNTPGYVTRAISDHGLIWIFTSRASSIWQLTGDGVTTNAYSSIPGSYAEGGCNFPFTIQKMGGNMMWVQSDDRGIGQVFVNEGYKGTRVSTHSVELWTSQLEDLSKLTSWTYQQDGHTFYILNHPDSDTTWAFDLTTKAWSERVFFKNGEYNRDLIANHCVYGQMHLAGAYNSGKVFSLNNEVYTIDGEPMLRERISPTQSNSLNRFFVSEFQLDLETGMGLDGLGYPYVIGQDTSATPVTQTLTNWPLKKTNTYNIFNFLNESGQVIVPTSVTSISATGTWSNTYTWVPGTNYVTIDPTTITIATTQYATGNGSLTNFTFLTGGLPTGSTILTADFINADWRGYILQSLTPITNLCTSSENFNLTPTWKLTGATVDSNGWTLYPSTTNAYLRPTSYTITENTSGNSNAVQKGDFYTYLTAKNVVAHNSNACTLFNPGAGYTGYKTTVVWSGFGTGTVRSGKLYVSLNTTVTDAQQALNYGPYTAVKYSIDGGSNWVTGGASYYNAGGTPVGDRKNFNFDIPVEIPLTGINDSLLRVKVELFAAAFIYGASANVETTLADILFVATGVTTDGPTEETAPDGSATGSYLIESNKFETHNVATSVQASTTEPLVVSFYAQTGDSLKSIAAWMSYDDYNFTATLQDYILTVIAPPVAGSLTAGMRIYGQGLPPNGIVLMYARPDLGTNKWQTNYYSYNQSATLTLNAQSGLLYRQLFQLSGTGSSSTVTIDNQVQTFYGSVTGSLLTIVSGTAPAVNDVIFQTYFPSVENYASGIKNPATITAGPQYYLSQPISTPITNQPITWYKAVTTSVTNKASITAIPVTFAASMSGDTLSVSKKYIGDLIIGRTINTLDNQLGTVTITSKVSDYEYKISPSYTGTLKAIWYQTPPTGGTDTGVYRCEFEYTPNVSGTQTLHIALFDTNDNYTMPGSSYTGNGATRVGIWGAQIEKKSTLPASQYLKTAGGITTDDYVTPDLTSGTVGFKQPPSDGALLLWSGTVEGISDGAVTFLGTYDYSKYPDIITYIGKDPFIGLSVSDDGGHSFGPEVPASLGKTGDYVHRAIWRRLGKTRMRVYKVRCISPNKFNLIGCEVTATGADGNTKGRQ